MEKLKQTGGGWIPVFIIVTCCWQTSLGWWSGSEIKECLLISTKSMFLWWSNVRWRLVQHQRQNKPRINLKVLLCPSLIIWGSGLFLALALRPGGIGAPQIGGFCGSVAFWGVFASKRGIQAILPLWAPWKAIYHQYRVFYPCGLPKKPFGPLTWYFTPVCSSKSHLAPNTMVFSTVSTVLLQTDWKNWYFSPNAAN